MKGGVSLLAFVRRRLDNLCIGGGRCHFVAGVVFARPLFLFVQGIVGVGITPWLRPGREALWGVGRKRSILLPSRSLVGLLRTRGTLG